MKLKSPKYFSEYKEPTGYEIYDKFPQYFVEV